MTDQHGLTAKHVASTPRGAMRLPGWYPAVWAAVMLVVMLAAPVARLTHAAGSAQAMWAVFLVLLAGSRLGLSAWRRAHVGLDGLGVLPLWLIWATQVVGTVGGFLASLAITGAGHPVLAVVLSLLVVAATTAVLVHHNGGLRHGRAVRFAP